METKHHSHRPFLCGITSVLIALLAVSTPITSTAAPVDQTRAERVARNFWNSQHDKDVASLTAPMHAIDTRWNAFYIFTSDEADGFVIVATDDCVQPILGFSFHNVVMREQPNRELAWWLNGYQQQIDYCRNQNLKPSADVATDWEQWENATENTPKSTSKAVDQLLTTQWDQGYPYNLLCPRSNGNHPTQAVTGCVATAMAQVMRYWKHPVRGTGSHTYTPIHFSGRSLFGTQSVDFSATVYDWDNMPNRVGSTSTEAERQAVATLMYHCGVAVDMQYGTSAQGGSGAYTHNIPILSKSNTLNGMINFFGYSSQATALIRKKYDDITWTGFVRAELRAGRPVIYTGGDDDGGHCFVCDGFRGLGYFHFNWGWGGIGDGDFILTNLVPGSGGIGGGNYSFNDNQEILIGIQPPIDDDSLCIIRQFPYHQDFETAPACWSAEGTRYGFTWWIWDEVEVDGNFSAYVMAPEHGSSEDHLYTPYLCTPGHYKLHWQARSVAAVGVEQYTVETDHRLLLSDTLYDGNWVEREVLFDIADGDTIRLDFHYTYDSYSIGVMVDHILIEKVENAEIANPVDSQHTCQIYPNPTSGQLHISTPQPLLRTELLDFSGRQVLVGTDCHLDLSALSSGIYLLRVTTPQSVETHRVVKK